MHIAHINQSLTRQIEHTSDIQIPAKWDATAATVARTMTQHTAITFRTPIQTEWRRIVLGTVCVCVQCSVCLHT